MYVVPLSEPGDVLGNAGSAFYMNSLALFIKIDQYGAIGSLYLADEDIQEGNTIARYNMSYPITTDSIKAMVLSTISKYIDYLQH